MFYFATWYTYMYVHIFYNKSFKEFQFSKEDFCLTAIVFVAVRRLSLVSARGLLFLGLYRLLISVASLVVTHGLWVRRASVVASCRFSSCGTGAQLPHGVWNLLNSGFKSMPFICR